MYKKASWNEEKEESTLIVNRCLKTLRSLLNGILVCTCNIFSGIHLNEMCECVRMYVCVCAYKMYVCIGLCDHLCGFSECLDYLNKSSYSVTLLYKPNQECKRIQLWYVYFLYGSET